MAAVDLAARLHVAMRTPGRARLLELADRQELAAERAVFAAATGDSLQSPVLRFGVPANELGPQRRLRPSFILVLRVRRSNRYLRGAGASRLNFQLTRAEM